VLIWTENLLDELESMLSSAAEVRVFTGNTSGGPAVARLAARARAGAPVWVATGCGGGTTRREALEHLRDSGVQVRVVDDRTGERFHAKIYATRQPDGSCVALVGSANLSGSAFEENVEAMAVVPLSGSEWDDLLTRIHRASPVLEDWDELGRPPPPPPPRGRIALRDVLGRDWAGYVAAVRHMDAWWRPQGLRVFGEFGWLYTLDQLRTYAQGPLGGLSELGRKTLVGKVPSDDVAFFGDFNATPKRQAILHPDKAEHRALAADVDWARAHVGGAGATVPLDAVDEAVHRLIRHSGVWLGVASRLLLSVRPDVFVSVNSRSRDGLRAQTGIRLPEQARRSRRSPEYTALIERVQQSPWYDVPQPTDPVERRIWNARASLLDIFVLDL